MNKSFLAQNESNVKSSLNLQKKRDNIRDRNIDGTCAWVYQLAIKVSPSGKTFYEAQAAATKERKKKSSCRFHRRKWQRKIWSEHEEKPKYFHERALYEYDFSTTSYYYAILDLRKETRW